MNHPDMIRVHIGNYAAEIQLQALPDMPRKNFRKVLRCLADPRNEYPEDLHRLGMYLLKQIDVSGTALAMAETACQTGLRKVDNPRSKNPEAIHILRENGRLIKERRSAKHIYKGWLSLYEIYESFEKGL